MSGAWTELHGPRRFFSTLAEDVRQGACFVVALPRNFPREMPATIARHLERRTTAAVFELQATVDRARAPVDVLYARCRLEPPLRAASARTLVECEPFRDVVAIVDGTRSECDSEPWLELLGRYADLLRNRPIGARGVLGVVIAGEAEAMPSAGPALRIRRWDGHVSGLDVRSMVRARRRTDEVVEHDLAEDLREAIIAELAHGDIDLAQTLADAPLESLLAPASHLRDAAERHGWSAGRSPCWADGTDVRVDGRRRVHIARQILEATGERALQRHLWRAEVGVLFPYIEDARHELLDQCRARLQDRLDRAPVKTAAGAIISVAEDLELSHIADLLRAEQGRAPSLAAARSWAELLRDARNDLAHQRPVHPVTVLRLCAAPA